MSESVYQYQKLLINLIALDSDSEIAKTGNIKTELRAAHITVRNKPHTTLHIYFYFAYLGAWR